MVVVAPAAQVVLPVPELEPEPEPVVKEPGLALVAVAPQLLPEPELELVSGLAPEPVVVVGQPR